MKSKLLLNTRFLADGFGKPHRQVAAKLRTLLADKFGGTPDEYRAECQKERSKLCHGVRAVRYAIMLDDTPVWAYEIDLHTALALASQYD